MAGNISAVSPVRKEIPRAEWVKLWGKRFYEKDRLC
jgi:hypothetical protein